ncbi:hypothetical protein Scep_020127 [Stephania cephalantha]|uniref:Uncharacterized protein n=1 Tax=Stephania cephalantha TaxID=152367 RepID=A0AAP0ICJ4_9MAGN
MSLAQQTPPTTNHDVKKKQTSGCSTNSSTRRGGDATNSGASSSGGSGGRGRRRPRATWPELIIDSDNSSSYISFRDLMLSNNFALIDQEFPAWPRTTKPMALPPRDPGDMGHSRPCYGRCLDALKFMFRCFFRGNLHDDDED